MTKLIIIAIAMYLENTNQLFNKIIKSVYMEGVIGSLGPLFIPIPSYCMFRY